MAEIKEQLVTLDNPYFKVLTICNILPKQLTVENSGITKTDPEFAKLNDENWQREVDSAKTKGVDSTNKTQFTLEGFTLKEGRLTLNTLNTDWKTFRFTRNEDVRKKFEPAFMADILGTNVVIITADKKLIFVRRSPKGYKPGAASTVGGYPDTETDLDANGNWDPFKTITRELEEETSIKPDELIDITLSGIIYNKDQKNANLAFTAKTSLSEEDLRKGLATGARKTDKEVDLKFIPDTREDLRNLSLWYAMANSPAGISTLAFYGTQQYGPEFLNFIQERLNKRGQKYKTYTEAQQNEVQQKASNRLSRFDSIKLQD